MMRFFLLSLFSAFFGALASAPVTAQDCRNQHEVEYIGYEKIQGPVDYLTVEIETLVAQGHTLFTNPGKPYLFAKYGYDALGRLIWKNFYRIDGVALPKSTYIYDASNKLVKEQDYSAVTNAPYLETIYNYENGRLKNSIGSNIEKKDGFLSRTDFSYDPKRRYFEFVETYSYPSAPLKLGFVQDEKCRFSQVIFFDKSGSIAGRNTFSFDGYGNPILVESLSHDGKSAGKGKYLYEYDKHRNWIKQSKYRWHPTEGKWTLEEIAYRTITYRIEK